MTTNEINSPVFTKIVQSIFSATSTMKNTDSEEVYVVQEFEDITVTTHVETNNFCYFTAIDPENEIFFTDSPEELFEALYTALVLS